MIINELPVLIARDPPGIHSIKDRRIGINKLSQLLSECIEFSQMSFSFSFHDLQKLEFKLFIGDGVWKSVREWLSVQLFVEFCSSTACIHVLKSGMLMNTFVLDSLSKLHYTVLAKMGVAVAGKTNLGPVITKNMVLLLLDPVKDGFFYFYPGESFGVED